MTMTTKVEPTVEKWERSVDVENLAYQIVYKIGDEIIPTGVGTLTSKRLAEEIEPILTKLLSHSVQEAKAEERERTKAIVIQHCKYTKRGPIISGANLDDLLSTLNTKEGK